MGEETPAPFPYNVWLGFLDEWAEDARQKGSVAQSVYIRARRSLRSADQVFTHPRQLTKLNGIGTGIARKIEAAFVTWCENNGYPVPELGACVAPADRSHDAFCFDATQSHTSAARRVIAHARIYPTAALWRARPPRGALYQDG